jgi:peroxiredoxin
LDKKKNLPFYLENSDITIKGRLDSLRYAKITGSKTQDEYSVLDSSIMSVEKKYRVVAEAITNEMRAIQKDFLINNPNSFASPNILRRLFNDMKPDEIERIINAMDPGVANTEIVADIKAKIKAIKTVNIGQKAPDFTLNDIYGNPVSLSSKIGSELLLVDFWAAWCSPCRFENPNVVKVYNEFNKKGFDILGVSLDRTKADWVRAIADDKLTWTNVSDLQYFNSTAAKLYAVSAIPSNFLLDKNGIIIAKNIRGEALYNKVKELLSTER